MGVGARAWLGTAITTDSAGGFPAVTFTINVVGSFLLGLLLECIALSESDDGWRRRLRLLAGTGLLGGFTTYSAFVMQADQLLAAGAVALAFGYVVASVTLGLAAALGGVAAARTMRRREGR